MSEPTDAYSDDTAATLELYEPCPDLPRDDDPPTPREALDAATTATLDAIRARWEAARPGPWMWKGNLSAQSICLMSRRGWGDTVMDFRRWGMSGAQPAFNIDGLLYRAFQGKDGKSLMVAPESWNAWNIRGIDHPDAIAIAAAPQDVQTLLDIIDTLREGGRS